MLGFSDTCEAGHVYALTSEGQVSIPKKGRDALDRVPLGSALGSQTGNIYKVLAPRTPFCLSRGDLGFSNLWSSLADQSNTSLAIWGRPNTDTVGELVTLNLGAALTKIDSAFCVRWHALDYVAASSGH